MKSFVTGVGLFGRGIGEYARNPRMWLLGMIPAVLSATLFAVVLGLLFYFVGDIAGWLTGFAEDWPDGARQAARLVAAVALVVSASLLTVLTFTAVTLLIGDPFYERISELVENRHGGVPDAEGTRWWLNVWDSLRLIGFSVLVGIPLFAAGFIPVVGQFVVPVIGALFGGWVLALELVGVPFSRRGMRLGDRRRALRRHRPLAIGFGAVVFVCFLIPLGAILLMPAAVAGGALLARKALGVEVS